MKGAYTGERRRVLTTVWRLTTLGYSVLQCAFIGFSCAFNLHNFFLFFGMTAIFTAFIMRLGHVFARAQ